MAAVLETCELTGRREVRGWWLQVRNPTSSLEKEIKFNIRYWESLPLGKQTHKSMEK